MTETAPEFGIELSADGKRNAHHHICLHTGNRPAYAVCLHLCSERKKGRLREIYSECSAVIGKGECVALKMRKEEIEAGRAIYFEERVKNMPGFIDRAKEFVVKLVSPASSAKSAPVSLKKSSSVIDRIDDTSYASVITSVPESAKVIPIVMPKVEAKAGESLLEMAKRMMAK